MKLYVEYFCCKITRNPCYHSSKFHVIIYYIKYFQTSNNSHSSRCHSSHFHSTVWHLTSFSVKKEQIWNKQGNQINVIWGREGWALKGLQICNLITPKADAAALFPKRESKIVRKLKFWQKNTLHKQKWLEQDLF